MTEAAKNYDVHIYAVARVKVPGIAADSPLEAIQKAEASIDLDRVLQRGGGDGVEHVEYAEDIVDYLVDKTAVDGDGDKEVVAEFTFDADHNEDTTHVQARGAIGVESMRYRHIATTCAGVDGMTNADKLAAFERICEIIGGDLTAPTVLVHEEGGVIDKVESNLPGLRFIRLDYDVDGPGHPSVYDIEIDGDKRLVGLDMPGIEPLSTANLAAIDETQKG